MYNRRRGRSSSSPTQPTSAALIAATAVYRPDTSSPDPHLAAAAAGAALRHVTVTPTPPGTIQTKRMLQRRDSYSSVTPPSDSENGPRRVQRSHSTSSLTERRFRKPKPLPPPSPPAPQQQYYQRPGATNARPRNKGNAKGYFPSSSSDESDSGEDSSIRRSTSVRSTSSNPSFPSTLRGPAAPDRKRSKPKRASPTRGMLSRGSLRDPKPASPPYPDQFHRRPPEPDSTVQNRRKNQQAGRGVYQAEYAGSVCSTTGNELGSIAEEHGGGRTAGRTIRNVAPSRIKEEDSEDQDEASNFRRRDKIGATRRPSNKVHETSSIPRAVTHTTSTSPTRKPNSILSLPSNSPERAQSRRRGQSHSPSRTHFSLNTTEGTLTKHSPPPRSVSPAKSALKHRPASPPPLPPLPANSHMDNPPSSPSGRKARVSFSDEDSVASFIHGRAPISTDSTAPLTPHTFGDVRRTGQDAPQNGDAKNTAKKSLPPAIYSISPPPSSSSQEDLRLEQRRTDMAGSPDGRLGYTPPETSPSSSVLGKPVPELVVVLPTPREEKSEDEVTGSAVQMPGDFPTSESPPADATAQAREDCDGDSDGASIYSDAYEDLEESALPNIMQVADPQEASSSSSPAPRAQAQPSTTNPSNPQNDTQTSQTKLTKSYKKESPPLPPDFISAFTSTLSPSSSRRPQAPIRTRSTSPSSSDAASITSISSFKRAHPRQPRTGMRSTMRSDPPPSIPSASRPHQKPTAFHKQKPKQTKSTLRHTSRIPDSSDEDDDGYQRPTFQSRFADSDDEDFAIGAAASASAGRKAKLRRKRTNSSTFSKKEENVAKEKKGFWSRFRKEKKEPGVIGSRSESAAAAVVPDAAVNNAANPPGRTRTIRKQKTWAGPEANPASVRAESPPPRVKEKKKGWKRFFGN
ncbi:hypothetical protein B9Z19DRAFT_207275 [Tuber borchii]|uniref:Uncharacterized protein n=1 Tax=Tuber borchii TaxID=42251 RepID=A0A2T6ZN66_TUBBO|nr:hypothetical protein B9Z19DRAFT_207275 [Tuber borchii]